MLHALHASGFPRSMRYASIILLGDDAWLLTELSNVVAYACRHSPPEYRHMAFFRDLSTGVQSFGIQSFVRAESDRAERGTGCSRGAVDWRIACGNCGNPIDAQHWRPRARKERQATPERWVEFASVVRNVVFIEKFSGKWRMGWDSNPRCACTHAGFQDRCLKPLGHPSVIMNSILSGR